MEVEWKASSFSPYHSSLFLDKERLGCRRRRRRLGLPVCLLLRGLACALQNLALIRSECIDLTQGQAGKSVAASLFPLLKRESKGDRRESDKEKEDYLIVKATRGIVE